MGSTQSAELYPLGQTYLVQTWYIVFKSVTLSLYYKMSLVFGVQSLSALSAFRHALTVSYLSTVLGWFLSGPARSLLFK